MTDDARDDQMKKTIDEFKVEIATIKASQKAFKRGQASMLGLWCSAGGATMIGQGMGWETLIEFSKTANLWIGAAFIATGVILFMWTGAK